MKSVSIGFRCFRINFLSSSGFQPEKGLLFMIYRLHFEISKVYVSLIANISYTTLIFPRLKSNPGPFFQKKGDPKAGWSLCHNTKHPTLDQDIFV